jgi:dipeptidase E
MRNFFGSISSLLFIPYALRDADGYVTTLKDRGLDAEYDLVGIHRLSDPGAAIRAAEGIFVGGGNTFRLLDRLYRLQLLSVIRERVLQGLPYLGVSAGCNIATPTVKTTNDMPIVQPPSFAALGLVPFQVNAHYYSGPHAIQQEGAWVAHFGETRDERLAEFHEENPTPVVGLAEGATLWCEAGQVRLQGGIARVFQPGEAAVDVPPDTDLAPLLTPRPRVAYTVRVHIQETSTAQRWLKWMQEQHLAEVQAAGAQEARLVEIDCPQGRLFEAQYVFAHRAAFEAYEACHAPRLRAEGLRLFPTSETLRYERSVGELRWE